ncbi:hypothetical protein [Desulfocurvus sp. DL9XJH121]
MPIDHISIDTFVNAKQFDSVHIDGSKVIDVPNSDPDAVQGGTEAKVDAMNKNINAIEAFKQSLNRTFGGDVGTRFAKDMEDIFSKGKPLTGRLVEQGLKKGKDQVIYTFCNKFCYDRNGDPSDDFKNHCRKLLEPLGFSPSYLDSSGTYAHIAETWIERLRDEVEASSDLPDLIGDIAMNRIDSLCEEFAKTYKVHTGDYERTLRANKQLTPKFEAIWREVAGDSPFAKLVSDVRKAELISVVGEKIKTDETIRSDKFTLKEKEPLCDQLLKDEITRELDYQGRLEHYKSLSPDIERALTERTEVRDELAHKLEAAHAKQALDKPRAVEVLKEVLAEHNATSLANQTGLKNFAPIQAVCDDLFRNDAKLKDFPFTINKAMADKLISSIQTSVKANEKFSREYLTKERFAAWAKEPARQCLLDIMDNKNLSRLVDQTNGLRNKEAVRDLCIGIMGDRLLTEDLSDADLKDMVDTAQKKADEIVTEMTRDASYLVLALKTPGAKEQVFESMRLLQKRFNELPAQMDTQDKFKAYNTMMDTAMAALRWDSIKDLRTAGIKFQELGDEFRKKDGDRFDSRLANTLASYVFQSNKHVLAGHASTNSIPKQTNVACMDNLLKRIGQAFVDRNMPNAPKQLQGQATVLGKGVFNTVFKGTYNKGYQGVFKPILWSTNTHAGSGEAVGIDHVNNNFHVRNVVARDLERHLLDSHLLPDCEFTKQGGKRGILMAFKPGSDRTALDRTDFTLRRQATKLAFLDAMLGQVDRHHNNFTIQTKDGKITGITGIDNDMCLGTEIDGMNPTTGEISFPGANHALKFLPPIIEKADYDAYMAITPETIEAIVGDSLSPQEVKALEQRVEFIQSYLETLNGLGRVLDADEPGFQDTFTAIYEAMSRSYNSYLETSPIRNDFGGLWNIQ